MEKRPFNVRLDEAALRHLAEICGKENMSKGEGTAYCINYVWFLEYRDQDEDQEEVQPEQ